MSYQKTSLSPAQIQFLKISPKIGHSQDAKRHMMQIISEQQKRATQEYSTTANSINKVPKFAFGQFDKTVNNFGVLLNKNFGTETTIHQMQKFGSLAKAMNKVMQAQNDKPLYNQKKNAILKKIRDRSDNRTFLKSIYDLDGQKIYVVLKSFNIETASAHKTMDGLPIPYLKFLISHVNSSRLAKIIEGAIKNENNMIVVDFEKMQSRALHLSNSESKYQNIPYNFQRMGQQLHVTLPYIQFSHIQSNFQQILSIQNREILQIIDSNFDNVGEIIQKYLEKQKLYDIINSHKKTDNKNSFQAEENQQFKLAQKGIQQQQSNYRQNQENQENAQNQHGSNKGLNQQNEKKSEGMKDQNLDGEQSAGQDEENYLNQNIGEKQKQHQGVDENEQDFAQQKQQEQDEEA